MLEVERSQIHPDIKPKNTSPFVNQSKNWDNKEHFDIPEELVKGIKDHLLWDQPSRIQSVAIPYIVKQDEETKEFDNLIAQAKNGAGKTGAFVIGSLLRIDPTIKKLQVVAIGHTRELVNQTAEVYKKAVAAAPQYSICNLLDAYDRNAQVIVSTLGSLNKLFSGREKVDLSEMRVFILDEADDFFMDKDRESELMKFHTTLQKLGKSVQYILFSATYDKLISEKISKLVKEANQINLKVEQLKLENIQQFYVKCNKGQKIDFVKQIYD